MIVLKHALLLHQGWWEQVQNRDDDDDDVHSVCLCVCVYVFTVSSREHGQSCVCVHVCVHVCVLTGTVNSREHSTVSPLSQCFRCL